MLNFGASFAIGYVSGAATVLLIWMLVSYSQRRKTQNESLTSNQNSSVKNDEDIENVDHDHSGHIEVTLSSPAGGGNNNSQLRPTSLRPTSLPSPSMETSFSSQLSTIESSAVDPNSASSFLSAIIAHLWEKSTVAVSVLVKEEIEPQFQELLPGPLKSLRFSKLDLGRVPIKLENIWVHSTRPNTVQIDLDVIWDGECDVKLSVLGGINFGVKQIKLAGRLSILLGPLIGKIPVVSAAQASFINPPQLSLDFTGLANVADFRLIDQTIRNIISDILKELIVLPQRLFIPVDPANDFVGAYLPPLGILRVVIVSGRGFSIQKGIILRDVPDVYVKTTVGASEAWRTKTIWNDLAPRWDESCDFLLSDYEQFVSLEVYDEDQTPFDGDDFLGRARVSVADIIKKGGRFEVPLEGDRNSKTNPKIKANSEVKNERMYITLSCRLHRLTPDLSSFASPRYVDKDNKFMCGLLSVLVVRAYDIPGPKSEAASYVKISVGKTKRKTPVVEVPKGMDDVVMIDVLNPLYNSTFEIPLCNDMFKTNSGELPPVIFTLMNGKEVIGSTQVTYRSLIGMKSKTVCTKRNIGSQSKLDIQVSLTGLVEESKKISRTCMQQDMSQNVTARPKTTIHSTPRLDGSFSRSRLIRVAMLEGRGFKIQKKKLRKNDIPDIYCVLRVGEGTNWRTKTVKDDVNPAWDESCDFIVEDGVDSTMIIECYDENRHGKDDFIGTVRIPLSPVNLHKPREVELLSSKGGPTAAYVTFQCTEVQRPTQQFDGTLSNMESSDAVTHTHTDNIIQLTVLNGRGFEIQKKSLRRIDIPDIYCIVSIPSSNTNNKNHNSSFRTTTIPNQIMPTWNESHLFAISHQQESVRIDTYDENRKGKDDYIGGADVNLHELLAGGGGHELDCEMVGKDGKMTGAFVTLMCKEMEREVDIQDSDSRIEIVDSDDHQYGCWSWG